MAREVLTGSRIRERRQIVGLRQCELARHVGISASYINLIEHNRRKIGGKLLLDIARVLNVDPALLTEGAEATLVNALQAAAADVGAVRAETDRAEEFAGRFPGWAAVLVHQHRRIGALQQAVKTLSDRFNQDPQLAASMHEVLSTATAIRSTAAILAEPGDIAAEWRDRFHRNLDQDSQRLAESSKALVACLDENSPDPPSHAVPWEEAEAFIARNDAHFPALETGQATPARLLDGASSLTSQSARRIAHVLLEQYADDARLMPLDRMHVALSDVGTDPLALAVYFGAPVSSVLRRLAGLPLAVVGRPFGLVICDASGSIVFRKTLRNFALPRFGGSCPLWPLYSALGRPLVPLRRKVEQLGRNGAVFDCIAISEPIGPPAFDQEPVLRATMLVSPATEDGTPAVQAGSGCRICPKEACTARREPSISG